MSVLADPVHFSLALKVNADLAQSPDGDFRCGICNKSYSRRDLRDRHRRRCIKTAGQERTSKRKSCETCAQKKVRCSMTRPACSRCVQTRTPCHYPPTCVPANPVAAAAAAAAAAAKNSNGHTTHKRSYSKTPSSCASSSSVSPSPPLSSRDGSGHESMAGFSLGPDVSSAATSLADIPATLPTPSEIAFPHLHQYQSGEFHPPEALNVLLAPWSPIPTTTDIDLMLRPFADSSLFPPHDLVAVDSIPWIDDLSPHSEHFPSDATHPDGLGDPTGLPPLLMSLHEIAKNPLDTMEEPFRIADGMAVSSDSLWHDRLAQSDDDDDDKPQFSTQLTFGHDFLPPSGRLSPCEANDLSQEMLHLMRQFPALIVERDFWSPFVHHRVHGGSLGGMAKPLGIALACVAAHASSGASPSNDGFVDRMVNQERERLVRNFHLYTDTPETCLAALHAVCIYQILGLFGTEFDRAAQLHSSFLNMTRHLYRLHRDALLIHHQHENDWTRWKFTESLRRNVFLVHIINILGARARTLHDVYFEPLGDDILLHLPLPAPEYMWRASSAEDWLHAREHALAASASAGTDHLPLSLTLHQLLQMDSTGGLDVSALLPLTRMVLACSKIAE